MTVTYEPTAGPLHSHGTGRVQRATIKHQQHSSVVSTYHVLPQLLQYIHDVQCENFILFLLNFVNNREA